MKVELSSLKVQFGALVALIVVSALYGLADGELSLWTPDQQGHRLFEKADYSEAATRFVDPMWKGVALFRSGEFEKAASLFAGYETADAAFNQGNALLMQGEYELAIERYARALMLRPNWEDAIVNQEIARGRAEALKQEGGEMTGGKLGADEIVFDQGKSSSTAGEEQVEGAKDQSDAELRSIWLRQVQTRPADFLRAKFAQQYATRKSGEP